MSDALLFQDLFLIWLVGLVGGLIAHLFKQPLLLGYMLGGLFISPFTPGPAVQHVETIQRLANFGVILLMFSVGLELAPTGFRSIGKVSAILGVLKTLVLVGLWIPVGQLLGWSLRQSAVIGFALSISSTMVITKMLMERKELKTTYGQTLLGVAIIEDCVMMGFLLFLPIMANAAQWSLGPVLWVVGKAVGLLALIFTLGVRIVPRVLEFVGRAHDPELSVLVLLVIALGIGVIGVWAGLSLALGAFIAGLVVSGSETTSLTMGRMLPMRDLFVVTFFVSLGVLLDPYLVVKHRGLLMAALGFVLFLKLAVNTVLCLVFRCPWAVAWRVGVGLAHIGEFSVVLCSIAKGFGLIAPELYNVIVAVSLLSILINTFVCNLFEQAPSALSSLRSHRQHVS